MGAFCRACFSCSIAVLHFLLYEKRSFLFNSLLNGSANFQKFCINLSTVGSTSTNETFEPIVMDFLLFFSFQMF